MNFIFHLKIVLIKIVKEGDESQEKTRQIASGFGLLPTASILSFFLSCHFIIFPTCD